MKKYLLLFGLIILISTFLPAQAQIVGSGDFEVEIPPEFSFVNPDDMLTYHKASTDLYLDIKIGNNSGFDISGFGEQFRFYAKIDGVETDGIPITWIDAGGDEQGWDNSEGSIVGMNGWEDDTYFGMLNEVAGFSWDGNLPDSMGHYTATMTGWPDGDPTLTRYRFHFSVPVSAFSDPPTDVVEICIDEYYSEPYDPMGINGFDGPYCFEFMILPFVEPEFEYVPPTMTTTHDEPYFVTLNIASSEFNTITGAGAVDEFGEPIGIVTPSLWGDQIQWNFHPPCEWVNDGLTHTVSFYLEDETNGYVYPNVELYTSTLIVNEGGPPVISGDCGATWVTAILHTASPSFEVTNANEDELYWSYTVSPSLPTGIVEFIDGVLSYSPCPADEQYGFFTFTIYVEDCFGNQSHCDVDIEIISCCPIHYHDPNSDGEVNILDVVFLINNIYKGGPPPEYPPSADWNLDDAINILDAVYIINFIYKDGSYPAHNYSSCSGRSTNRNGCL